MRCARSYSYAYHFLALLIVGVLASGCAGAYLGSGALVGGAAATLLTNYAGGSCGRRESFVKTEIGVGRASIDAPEFKSAASIFHLSQEQVAKDISALDIRASNLETTACHLLRDKLISPEVYGQMLVLAWQHRAALDAAVDSAEVLGGVPIQRRLKRLAEILRGRAFDIPSIRNMFANARTDPLQAWQTAITATPVYLSSNTWISFEHTQLTITSALPPAAESLGEMSALAKLLRSVRDSVDTLVTLARSSRPVLDVVRDSVDSLIGLTRTSEAILETRTQALNDLGYRELRDSIQVSFAYGRAAPDSEERHNLLQWVKARSARVGVSFSIVGYADATGSTAYNVSLSRRRAEAVERLLSTEGGVSPLRIALIGGGATTRFSRSADRSGDRNNRVAWVFSHSARATNEGVETRRPDDSTGMK